MYKMYVEMELKKLLVLKTDLIFLFNNIIK